MAIFAVLRRRGDSWDKALPLDAQEDWRAHADFMTALQGEGFALLAGPLEDNAEALLILRAENEAEIEARLASDPWTRSGMLETVRISRWNLRLGTLP